MLSFLLARDTMHQNQWLAAIQELEEDGLEATPCPSNFPQELELQDVSYKYMSFCRDSKAQEGRWASGRSIDGRGEFEAVMVPEPHGEIQELGEVDPRLHGTPKHPMKAAA